VEQQDKYARSGFELAHRNVRYGGKAQNIGPTDPAVLELGSDTPPVLVDAVVAYDRQFFPASRDDFIRRWVEPGARRAVAYVSDRTLLGHGVIRPCRDGHKIGPLFADDADIAEALFNALVAPLGDAPLVFLDVPEPNEAARRLAERHGLEPVFETARMYKGTAPDLPLDRIFGITTFELGLGLRSAFAFLQSARLRQRQPHDALPVLIGEAQALARGDHLRGEGIVAQALAADMRRDAADIRRLFVFDPEQPQRATVGDATHKGDARQAQEARRVGGLREVLREARLDQIEVRLRHIVMRVLVAVWLLPLRHLRRGVVTGRRRQPVAAHAAMMMVMSVLMGMIVIVHGSCPYPQ
jgi:hypothetical protein